MQIAPTEKRRSAAIWRIAGRSSDITGYRIVEILRTEVKIWRNLQNSVFYTQENIKMLVHKEFLIFIF